MNFSLGNKILAILLFFAFGCTLKDTNSLDEFEAIYNCGAEKFDPEKWKFEEADNKPQYFGNVETKSDDVSFSGKHSLKLTPTNPYGFTTKLDHVGADEYIQVTVWRKNGNENENGNGILVIDGGKGFYNAGKQVIDKKDGWEKLFLEVFTPPTFLNNKITIFAWNNSRDSVYFDDLKILHRNKKIYSDFEGIPALQIHADQLDLQKFNRKRVLAFETTVLENSDEDYSSMVLYDGNDFLNGDFRLKGDLVDHIQGQKWSFRIKLKKEFAWNHLRTFSLQNPSTRGYLQEWLAHKVFQQEDVLTSRYGFVPLRLNNESLGIYAWEEHFDKQLIESQNRREGPIVRFDESLFWKRVIETKHTQREWDIDYFNAAKIIPFKEGRTTADSMLNMQLVEAQKLMLQYRKRLLPVSLVFDIDKLAKYYALIDITQAYHGFAWHNQRFYFNPVTCLLEPIAFDGYIEGGIYKRIDEQLTGLFHSDKIISLREEELILFQVFSDNIFRKRYIEFLAEYSSPDFINDIISTFQPETDSLSVLIKKEIPYYKFNYNYIKWQAEYIQNNIVNIKENIEKIGEAVASIKPEQFKKDYTSDINEDLIPLQINAYYNKKEKQIDILNFHNEKVKVLGTFINEGFPENYEEKPELLAYDGTTIPHIILPVTGTPTTVLFEINKELFETEISQWPYSDTKSHRQIAIGDQLPVNIPIEGKSIVFDGKYQFKEDIVIPDSFRVIAKAGTQIDFIEGASFISFAAIHFTGTAENPIRIGSSDNSANGFNILQVKEKSVLKHVHFLGLSSLKKAGWQTPAAITLYEADVELKNCVFASNSNCDDALNIVRSHFDVKDCKFINTFADAFDSDFCTGLVSNCIFENIGNDAIDFSGSQVTISDCKMIEIADKAISGGENSKLIVSNCEIIKANIGVAAKDLSHLKLDKIVMDKTVYGIVAFQKKPEYGSATITIDNLKMKNNVFFHQIELGSSLTLNGKLIEGREKKLAVKLYQ